VGRGTRSTGDELEGRQQDRAAEVQDERAGTH
jgi:hypothetical protein